MLQSVSPSPEIQSPSESAVNSAQTVAIDITGMKCAGCVRVVEQELQQCAGVQRATVNLATEVATVQYEPTQVAPTVLAEKLTEAGFPSQARLAAGATGGGVAVEIQAKRQAETRQQFWRLAIAMGLLVLSALGHLKQLAGITVPGLSNIWFHFGLATLALLGPGRGMAIDGWRGLRRHAPNMNTLVSLGTLTAYFTSLVALFFPQLGWECFFDEPVMLVGFILLGRTLEQQARNRAASAFQSLLALQPKQARLIKAAVAGSETALFTPNAAIEIPAESVRLGEWLQVLPGDRIPVDGDVVAGQTTVDESMLTGEAIPVLKQPGDRVAAGTLNQSGAIALRTTRTGSDTTLAQIIHLVETAQTRKAPIQKLADLVAGYFTYGVMAIAALTFLFWYGFGAHQWPHVLQAATWSIGGDHAMHLAGMPHAVASASPLLLSLKLAIAVLVVACPCALGLATPTAILVGSGIGAERGLLIRGSDVLERVHSLDTIVLDKTGTLTSGHPVVTDCWALAGDWQQLTTANSPEMALLQLAATVESGTRHPLAIAIQAQAQAQTLDLLPAQDFTTVPGLGVAAQILAPSVASGHQTVTLGTELWLQQQHIHCPAAVQAQAHRCAQAGKTVVYVAVDKQAIGVIAVADQVRPDAAQTIATLQAMGLTVLLLTGDRQETATAIAHTLNLPPENVFAQVQPAAKATAIAQLQAQNHQVAMVGDGINDAPALAQANVGIALHSGTDVATETADIILMRDRLPDLLQSLHLSHATFNKIRQNLFWAFAYNLMGIPLAAGLLLPSHGILLSPAAAGAMMAFSSVSVVTNSLLLYLKFPRQKSVPTPTPKPQKLPDDVNGAQPG